MKNKEVWIDITNYEGLYQYSQYGNIKSLITGRILKQTGHGFVGLRKNNETKYVNARTIIDNNSKNLDGYPIKVIDTINVISKHFNVLVDNWFSKSRKKEYISARRFAFKILKETTNMSSAEIGKYIGNKDSGTVRKSNNELSEEMTVNKKTRDLYVYLLSMVESKPNQLVNHLNELIPL